jgi:hippurate hydrolase
VKAFLFLLFATTAHAGVDDIISKEIPRLEKIYQDLHRNPEVSFKEEKTAAKLAAELRALGLEVREKIGGTGIAGILRNGEGPVTIVRTELDALPMTEKTGLPFASTNPNAMHSCAHDFHMASFLGTAATMVKIKDQWSGTLVFIGQPAEEIGQGAKAMMADPEWKKLSTTPGYTNPEILTNITNVFLRPTGYSQI